jgi:formylglycine-generating enzyme required for sulfatase activity
MIACAVLLALLGAGLAWTTDQAAPPYHEKEGRPTLQQHKKFPWLPVLLGVGAGVVLVMLLTRKKEQTLTVDLRVGTSGQPTATAKYKRGTAVDYAYEAKAGFNGLQVRLDGVVVPSSGRVTMDRDHAIEVSAREFYTLTVEIGAGVSGSPSTSAAYARDTVVPYSYTALDASHSLQVRLDNVISPASGSVTMNSDHTLTARISQDAAEFSQGVLTVNGVRYEMQLIPAGEFQMGSDSPDALANEQPVHTVLISKPFWMGRTEVTQALWQAIMGGNPSKFKFGGDYPVEGTLWETSQQLIASLNQMLGSGLFRMPTEAEWEYACRAGTSADRYGELDAIAWYIGNSGGCTHPVGLKQPNHFGLYDMLGNVWEWCQDIYGMYQAGYWVDPIGQHDVTQRSGRIYRGGSWESVAAAVRSPQREKDHPNNAGPWVSVGLRLVRTCD